MSRVHLILKGGKPAFVVVPIDLWERVREAAEDAEDLLDLERFELADDGFRVPLEVVEAMLKGIHSLRAWREHRGSTQDAHAAHSGVRAPYLSRIEGGERAGADCTLHRIAAALDVPIDELTREAGGQP